MNVVCLHCNERKATPHGYCLECLWHAEDLDLPILSDIELYSLQEAHLLNRLKQRRFRVMKFIGWVVMTYVMTLILFSCVFFPKDAVVMILHGLGLR